MFVLSAGKSTILSQFDNFETTSIYQHANGETVDFQIFPQQQQHIFVEVNKKSGLEILRLKNQTNLGVQIQRVQKLNIEKVYCVACSKQSLNLISLGLSNGQVQIYNYKSSEFVNRFKPENNRNSVCFVDFNLNDEYITAVFDNGELSTYGIKTKTKLDTFKIDGLSTLARFHPSKRFYLGIASSAGAVTMYDVQSKKKVFHAKEAHVSPCRDLCMSSANLDTLVSVGYDCVVNIYDIRHRGQPQRIFNSHPLSAVSMSECGTFICVGSLKGEIIAYDVRQTSKSLREAKLHEGAVQRLTFVTNLEATTGVCNQSTLKSAELQQTESFNNTNVGESFSEIVDFQGMPSKNNNRRSSFNWESLTVQKPSELKDPKVEDTQTKFDFVNKKPRKPRIAMQPLSEQSDNESGKKGEKLQNSDDGFDIKSRKSTDEENKENLNSKKEAGIIDSPELLRTHLKILPANKNSTPEISERNRGVTEIVNSNNDLLKLVTDMRSELTERMENMEQELKFNAETNKWQIFTQAAKLWNEQNDAIAEIRDTLSVLVRADPFVNEFLRLKEENEQLKAQLNTILKK